MKILFVTAEVGPFVSVGGLSQVSYFLPNALLKLGDDVRIFTPKFGAMDPPKSENEDEDKTLSKHRWPLKMELEGLRVPLKVNNGGDDLICNVKSHHSVGRVKTYFLENREYYELRANVFGYRDDHIRFLLMSKGCLEWLMLEKQKENGWWPDIIHCNDWHSAYLIELAKRSPRYKKVFSDVKIVLTVHNFVYQGNFDFKYCNIEDKDNGKRALLPLLDPRMHTQNPLLRGLLHADAISTVSTTHAKEILTEEYGEGLHLVLQKRKSRLVGILNGLDTNTFDPKKDTSIKARFDLSNYESARAINKTVLQKLFKLPVRPKAFLLGYVGRLAQQKGINLITSMLPHLLTEYPNVQLVVVGGGDEADRTKFMQLQNSFPSQIGLHLMPDFLMPRKVFAGADAILLPSMFEPGGIVALESLRYGAVPIVRRTGGLNDIISDFEPVTEDGTGFSFSGKSDWALYGAIIEALTTFENKRAWNRLVRNCLTADFSWEHVAADYQKWYRQVRIDK